VQRRNIRALALRIVAGSEVGELLSEVFCDFVRRVDEPVVLDGMNTDAALLKADQMLSEKTLLGLAPFVDFGILFHGHSSISRQSEDEPTVDKYRGRDNSNIIPEGLRKVCRDQGKARSVWDFSAFCVRIHIDGADIDASGPCSTAI
jgi:hypothetical protein